MVGEAWVAFTSTGPCSGKVPATPTRPFTASEPNHHDSQDARGDLPPQSSVPRCQGALSGITRSELAGGLGSKKETASDHRPGGGRPEPPKRKAEDAVTLRERSYWNPPCEPQGPIPGRSKELPCWGQTPEGAAESSLFFAF